MTAHPHKFLYWQSSSVSFTIHVNFLSSLLSICDPCSDVWLLGYVVSPLLPHECMCSLLSYFLFYFASFFPPLDHVYYIFFFFSIHRSFWWVSAQFLLDFIFMYIMVTCGFYVLACLSLSLTYSIYHATSSKCSNPLHFDNLALWLNCFGSGTFAIKGFPFLFPSCILYFLV